MKTSENHEKKKPDRSRIINEDLMKILRKYNDSISVAIADDDSDAVVVPLKGIDDDDSDAVVVY